MTSFNESVVEEATLEWFGALGYEIRHGPEIGPGEAGEERADYGHVVLEGRLRVALARLNPDLPPETLADAFRRLSIIDGTSIVTRNHELHRMLVEGVTVEFRRPDGSIVVGPEAGHHLTGPRQARRHLRPARACVHGRLSIPPPPARLTSWPRA